MSDNLLLDKYVMSIKKSNIIKNPREYFILLNSIYSYIFKAKNGSYKDHLMIIISGKKVYEMRMIEFLIHLNFWRMNMIFKKPISDSDFYQLHPFTKNKYNGIMHTIFKKFLTDENDPDMVSVAMSNVNEFLVYFATDSGNLMGNTFSLYDVIKFSDRNKIFRELINTELPIDGNIKDAELFIDKGISSLKRIVIKDKKSNLYPYIQTNRFNPIQLGQMFIAVGYRTDLNKTIIPRPIQHNFLYGLKTPSEIFLEAKTSMISLMAKHVDVPGSGYLSRKINLLTLNTIIDYDLDDCGSKHYLNFYVASKEILNIIEGKNMILDDGISYKPIDISDTHLIGKTVNIRTIISCCNETHKICKACFGVKHKQMTGIRIGGLPATMYAAPIFQKSMSTKHSQASNSFEINSEIIEKFCDIDGTNLFIKKEYMKKNNFLVIDIIIIENIIVADLNLDDDTIDLEMETDDIKLLIDNEYHILRNDGATFRINRIISENKRFLLPNPDNDDELLIPLTRFFDKEDTLPIANITIITSETSIYLKMIRNKLDGAGIHNYTNYNELIQDLLDIAIMSNIKSSKLIHMETIVYNLIRSTKDILTRPDFNDISPDYKIISISNSIKKSDLYSGISFEYLINQFVDPDTFRKTTKGFLEPFFKTSYNPYL